MAKCRHGVLLLLGLGIPLLLVLPAYLLSGPASAAAGRAVHAGLPPAISTGSAESWTRQDSGTTSDLHDVDFVDNTEGWAVGDSGTILHTRDGGRTWTKQTGGTAADLFAVDFSDPLVGFAAGAGASILLTTDGGTTWTRTTGGQFDPPIGTGTAPNTFTTINAGDPNNVWAMGLNKLWYISDDGGQTWDGLALPDLASEAYDVVGAIPFAASAAVYSSTTGGRIVSLSDFGDVDLEPFSGDLRVGRLFAVKLTGEPRGLSVGETGAIPENPHSLTSGTSTPRAGVSPPPI